MQAMGGAIWMRWCQSHELHVAPLAAGAQMSDTPATRCCAVMSRATGQWLQLQRVYKKGRMIRYKVH
ncbi:hypothetical protein OsI_22530 [Oryza sativa Indica Group]|uniref:Uncharacterized protein n=2 Tax=Oryza sativa TaxID=4530 RepID=B9FSR0_ORYSJ|nr:hypothetical protein OsI_22530 [Oryza sativa Indica Group]EEE65521.1 hypothetical protein OsJ_20967 [Oryza sativa Japonica Group]